MRITTFITNIFDKNFARNIFFVNCMVLVAGFSIGRRKCIPATNYGKIGFYVMLVWFLLYIGYKRYSDNSQICTRDSYDSYDSTL